ncbi:MAG: thiamine phosphate synthase [Planctomycetota bacterium]|jgi:thiamine-phosphate pyrophosphorylase
MRDARLYLLVSCEHENRVVEQAIAGGVDAVQLRDKTVDDATYEARARELAALCTVPFLLNDRWHLVEQTGADGVHLGQEDAPIEQVRRALGPGVLLGLSTHDQAEAEVARERGADYIGLGPMFPTRTKRLTRTPGGAALLASVTCDLPVFAIGGITIENVASLAAKRIAVSSAIADAADPWAAAKRIRSLLTGF